MSELPHDDFPLLEFHKAAGLFPLMEESDFGRLRADIKDHGLREPLWTWRGEILDGRNRYRACKELGIVPKLREWDGSGSLVAFVWSLNGPRRHLDKGQLAAVGAEMLSMLEAEAKERQRAAGGLRPAPPEALPQKVEEAPRAERGRHAGEAAEVAARLVGTNRQYVAEAKKILEEAPELFGQVKAGEVKLREATAVARARKRARRCAAYERLDATTREILGEHELGYDTKAMRGLDEIYVFRAGPEGQTLRHYVARLLVEGKARSVRQAEKIAKREAKSSKPEASGATPAVPTAGPRAEPATTAPADGPLEEEVPPRPDIPPVGLARAHDAINALNRIPTNDPQRKRAFQMVSDYIRTHSRETNA